MTSSPHETGERRSKTKSVSLYILLIGLSFVVVMQLIVGSVLITKYHLDSFEQFITTNKKYVESLAGVSYFAKAADAGATELGVFSTESKNIHKINHLKYFFILDKQYKQQYPRSSDKQKTIPAGIVDMFSPDRVKYPGGIIMVSHTPRIEKPTAGTLPAGTFVFVLDSSWLGKRTTVLSLLLLIIVLVTSGIFFFFYRNIVSAAFQPVKELRDNLSFIVKSDSNDSAVIKVTSQFQEYEGLIEAMNAVLAKNLHARKDIMSDPGAAKDTDAFSVLLEEKDKGVMLIDQENKVLAINGYIEKLFDIEREHIKDKHYLLIDHPGLKKSVRALRKSSMENPGTFVDETIQIAENFHVRIEATSRVIQDDALVTLLYFT